MSVLVPVLRLRARSGRSPRPARRGFRRGAAAATAAIAAASLAMWLHFVDSPARRPPPPPALLPLLLLHRLPPSRALARSGLAAAAAASARPSFLHRRPGSCRRNNSPGRGGGGGESGGREAGAPGRRAGARLAEPAPLPALLLPGSEAAAALASSRLARSLRGSYTCVTDRAKSQLLPGSAVDVSDPQPLGGRIVQAE